MTEYQKERRLNFCQKYSEWSIDDWKCILWTDESPFELFNSSNHQNDRMWCYNSSEVTPLETIKFPPKIMVWGMMSHQVLSELHFVPAKQSENASYYVSEYWLKPVKMHWSVKGKQGQYFRRE